MTAKFDDMRAKLDAAAAERLRLSLDAIEHAGREFFLRECRAAGIDPERGVSPSLLKTLGLPAAATAQKKAENQPPDVDFG